MKFILATFLTIFLYENSNGHTYNLGRCPAAEPQPNFDMNQMLGLWYVIQKTSTASHCITYNFTKTDEPEEYELIQDSQHFVLGLTPLKHDYKYTGRLTVPDPSTPAKMIVKFPLSVAGTASYTIFMTDYITYAGIFTCQKLTFAHRESATILSREKTLDKIYIDKIRNRLASFSVDPYSLSIISQKNCPKNVTEGVNINIDSDTFAPKTIAGVVRKAGEKIGDGVEYIASGAKNIYDKYSDDDSNEGNTERSGRYVTANPNSEWLP